MDHFKEHWCQHFFKGVLEFGGELVQSCFVLFCFFFVGRLHGNALDLIDRNGWVELTYALLIQLQLVIYV